MLNPRTLLLILLLTACKKSGGEEKPGHTGDAMNPPPLSVMAMAPDMKAPVVKKPVTPKAVVKDAAWIVKKSNGLNGCILSAVKGIRALEGASAKDAARLKELSTGHLTCSNQLLKDAGEMPDISTPYKQYFILAATALDAVGTNLEARTATPPVKSAVLNARDASLNEAYNTFALQNNDLQGAPLLNPEKTRSGDTLDIQTYSDELARYGEVVWNNLNPWYLHHTLSAGGAASFTRKLRERVALVFVTQTLERQAAAFDRLKCVRGFTRTTATMTPAAMPAAAMPPAMSATGPAPMATSRKKESPLSCSVLKNKATALKKAAAAYTGFWAVTLDSSRGAAPKPVTAALEKQAVAVHEAVKQAVIALPPKIR